VPSEDNGVNGEEKEIEVLDGEEKANGIKEVVNGEEKMCVDKSSGGGNEVVDTEVEASSNDRSALKEAVVATPPKRRTGKVTTEIDLTI